MIQEDRRRIAFDHTNLLTRPRQIWVWKWHMNFPALIAAMSAGAVVLMPGLVFILASNKTDLVIALLFFTAVAAGAMYVTWASVKIQGMTPPTFMRVAFAYLWLPKRTTNFTADDLRDEYIVDVVVWRPTSREWTSQYGRELTRS